MEYDAHSGRCASSPGQSGGPAPRAPAAGRLWHRTRERSRPGTACSSTASGASATSSPPDSARTASTRCACTHPNPVTARSTSAAALATPPGGSPSSSGPRVRRSASMARRASSTPLAARRYRQRSRTAFPRQRRPNRPARRWFRLRLLAFRDDVLRQPRHRATKRPDGARTRRPPLHGRVATKLDNEWLHRAERVIERFLTRPETTDQPTCGPGPFSMANADTTTDVLVHAGFEDISLHRCDIEVTIGADLDQAVQFVMALGPAGELIRLAGARPSAVTRASSRPSARCSQRCRDPKARRCGPRHPAGS